MKNKVLVTTLLFVLSVFMLQAKTNVLSEDVNGIELEFKFSEMTTSEIEAEGDIYQKLSIEDTSIISVHGKPELPTVTKLIEVPEGTEVTVDIIDSSYTMVYGYDVYPFQETYDSAYDRPFYVDKATYLSNADYPGAVANSADVLKMRGHSLIPVVINPVQYNPVSKEVKVYSYIKIKVYYLNNDAKVPTISANQASSVFDGIVSSSVVNPKKANIAPMSDSYDTGANYLIITHDDFYDEVLPLKTHKEGKGLTVQLTKLSDISTSPSADDIRNYIVNAYNTWSPAPEYVLLVGDSDKLPVFKKNYSFGVLTATDLYYATMDSATDTVPDIFVGRFPVQTDAEATAMVNKAVNYETSAPTGDWRQRVLNAAYLQDDNGDGQGNRGYLETAEYARAFVESEGYTSLGVYTTNSPNPTTYMNGEAIPSSLEFKTTTAANTAIINAINEGIVLGAHRDHGSTTGWWQPSLTTTHISSLTNSEKLPLLMGIDCWSGQFDGMEGFGEQIVQKSDGGAIGYIGATVPSPTYSNHRLYTGLFDCVFPDYQSGYTEANSGSKKMGVILVYGKMYHYNNYSTSVNMLEMYNLLGDPELELKIGESATFNSTYDTMYFRGTPDNWNPAAMTLVDDYTWEINVTSGSDSNERFKFDVHGDWSVNFGDNNRDYIADSNSSDIPFSKTNTNYTIRFNDQTLVYTVINTSSPASTYSTMYFRGTPDNWNPTAMTLVDDYTWRIEATFGSASDERFKFDVYGDWSTNFGDNNNDGYVDSNGSDIYVTANTSYIIIFNTSTGAYSYVAY